MDTLSPYQIDEKEFNDVCHSNILEEIAKGKMKIKMCSFVDFESLLLCAN